MLMFASWGNMEDMIDPTRSIIEFAENLGRGQMLRVGWVRTDVTHRVGAPHRPTNTGGDTSSARWFRVKDSARHSELLLAVLHVSATQFGFCGCIGARIGRAVSSVEGILECSHTFIWWWHTDRPQQYWYSQPTSNGRVKLTDVFGKDD